MKIRPLSALSLVFVLLSLIWQRDASAQPLPEAARLPHPPGVALVLSGGGIKGFAHIGVLEVLDSAHVPIDLIVGTSIGAVVGGLYAAGYTPQELESFAKNINWSDVLEIQDESHRSERVLNQKDMDHALLSLRFTGFLDPVLPQAISSGQRLTMLLNSMVLGAPAGVPRDFLRDLRVPFIAVTTDIVRGERRLLSSGDLTQALRESATLPLRFSPLPEDSAILMDGGLMANIPADVAKSMGAERIVVSNATAALRPRNAISTPWDVADQVVTLMMKKQDATELKLSDCTIAPALGKLDETDFANIPAMIEAGRNAARTMLPSIERVIASTVDPPSPMQDDTLLTTLHRIRVFALPDQVIDSALVRNAALWDKPLTRSGSMKSIEQQLLTDYRSDGYSLARIDSVVISKRYGWASIYMDEGHIGRIAVHGNIESDSDFALRELPFNTGEIFRASRGEHALKNLTGTGLFDFALLQVSYDTLWPGTRYIYRDDTTIGMDRMPSYSPAILVTVHSKARNVIRLGVLADNEFGAEFSAELANENINGSGVESSILGSLGPLARSISLTIAAPRLFHSFGLLDATVYSGYRDINAYSLQTLSSENRLSSNIIDVVRESRDLGLRLRAGGQVEQLGRITVELRGEHQRWFSVRDSASDRGDLQLRAARGELLIDSRDDDAYPHNGTLARGYAETGLNLFGHGTNYTKVFAELEQAIPLSSLHTMIPRVRVGFGDQLLPRLEEFALGGMESFYGLNEYELRGKQMLEGSLTYQIAIPHALFFPTFVSVRYDVGSTWPEPTEIKFESLLHGIGAQVGLKTPLGLARFGIGENFRLVGDPSSGIALKATHSLALNNPRFYFSLGSRL